MATRFFLATTLLTGFAFFGIAGFSFIDKGQAQEIERAPNSDNLAIELLFRMVSSFENETKHQDLKGNSIRANAFRNFFQRKARLDEAQAIKLKEIAGSFAVEVRASLKNSHKGKELLITDNLTRRRLQKVDADLLQRYRERLISEIRPDFFDFVQNEIGRKITIHWNEKSRMFSFGSSTVDFDAGNNEIVGYSVTYDQGSRGCGDEEGSCYGQEVSATLSSDLNGVLDYQDSGEICGSDAEVYLYYSQPEPSVYCVGADHFASDTASPYCSWQGMSGSFSNDCLTITPPGMGSVDFQLIATDSPPIDTNPPDTNPDVDDGLRIFPDDNTGDNHEPGQGPNRQRIRVRAFLSEQIAGRTIYFKSFDIDDPSTDTVIDPDGDEGSDNNGRVNGHSEGELSAAQAITDSQGMAHVDLTVTMQPGDNFAIAASAVDNLGNVTVDGTELRTGAGTLIDSDCDGTAPICRSKMLTVWRRVHVEVDSMASSQQNFRLGNFGQTVKVGLTAVPVQVNLNQGQPPLEVNSLEGGRIDYFGNSFAIDSNTANSITIRRLSSPPVTVQNTAQFIAYDDDDFNDDDGTNKDGDTGEAIPALDNPNVNYTTLLKPTDTACSQTVTTNCNVLVAAYVRPVYDITTDTHDNSIFQANISPFDLGSVLSVDFDQITTEDNDDFWTIYVYGAYQGEEIAPAPGLGDDGDPPDTDGDGNPDGCQEVSYGGTTLNFGEALGSAIFLEVSRPHEYPPNYQNLAISRSHTIAHEVGHQFGGMHEDGGIMEIGCLSSPSTGYALQPDTIRRLRAEMTHP